MANLKSYKSGVAFWYGPMKSWPGGSPNSTHKNTPYRLDKSRSALAEARLKTIFHTTLIIYERTQINKTPTVCMPACYDENVKF